MKNWTYVEGAKTGNDTPWEYAHRKPKVINDDKTGAEEFFKQLSDDVKEREEKDDADIEKVGNALGKDIYQHKLDPNQYMVVDWDKDTVTIIVNGAVRDVIKNTDKVAYAVSHVYKKVNSMNKVGNASETDDKFAYVMSEFDEGKLKTPDGKVVTDPAQAKAIAYSESKKTENGLARARKAIK